MAKEKKTSVKKEKRPDGRKTNPWIAHVQAFRQEHPDLNYKEALQQAKATYTKK